MFACVRLDQTLGKPGATWMISNSRERQRMTVVARLARVEIQVPAVFSVVVFVSISYLLRKSHRPTRGSVSPYNTVGYFSGVSEEVATQIAENCRRRQPQCQLTPRPEDRREYLHTPYISRN